MKIIENSLNLIAFIYRLVYILRGKVPLTTGYSSFKHYVINKVISKATFDPHNIENNYGIGIDERIIEYPWFINRIPAKSGSLLDAGSILNHSFILSNKKFINKDITVLTLAPEFYSFWYKKISYVYGDMRNMYFKDSTFNWIVSISTLEHIGMDNTLHYTDDKSKKEENAEDFILVIKEFRRLLKNQGTLYLSFPFGKNEKKKWFQVFNSDMVDHIITTFKPSYHSELIYKYESTGWKLSNRNDCKYCSYNDPYSSKNNAKNKYVGAEAIICLELVK